MQIIFQIFQFHPLGELDSSWGLAVVKLGLSEAALTASPWSWPCRDQVFKFLNDFFFVCVCRAVEAFACQLDPRLRC